MSIMTRWEPMEELRQEMGRLFDQWGFDSAWPRLARSYPALNIGEDENFIYAEAELPGLKLTDLEITISGDNRLTIKGERKAPAPEKAEWHRQERGFGKFERTIEFPVNLDANKVEAVFENGVLNIKMAKCPKSKPRKIPVRSEP